MSQFYCDSKKLELNWFYWLLSSATPSLEQFRELGLLWTKVLDEVKDDSGKVIKKDGKSFLNPRFENRSHCIALPVPVWFDSIKNIPQEIGMTSFKGDQKPVVLSALQNDLNLLSDTWLFHFDDPMITQTKTIPELIANGYCKELPTRQTWSAMLEDIEKICLGITTKFNLPSDEERYDLAHEALIQVSKKLVNQKLVYIPGKAPVFNLLTTTIFRCMYSIMNRKKHQREGMIKLLDRMAAGTLPNNRSFRVEFTPKRLIRSR